MFCITKNPADESYLTQKGPPTHTKESRFMKSLVYQPWPAVVQTPLQPLQRKLLVFSTVACREMQV
jgi:hypothetical protein